MKTISLEAARSYARNASATWICSFENTKIFGEKGGHTAFCAIHFEDKNGGRGQDFQISKANFIALKNEGFKVGTNEQNL